MGFITVMAVSIGLIALAWSLPYSQLDPQLDDATVDNLSGLPERQRIVEHPFMHLPLHGRIPDSALLFLK
ncbi:hypothetical protein SCP_0307800 [Sparassis crispa]|uniref:Uncharacterized protein n=1 Tax=Sparassis crispa TaxID=139825 RepID=A0A401GFU1_9APHY|nr:hypothetical protein SCP_0307800 [Sparassis crispa]GBE81056.1 hypothetical protein SCP_0307800 [Sparassis crispa]